MEYDDLTTLDVVKEYLNVTGLPIATISNAATAVLTLSNTPQTPLRTGASYSIEGVSGMTGVNGTYAITVTDPKTFTIPVNTTSAGTYTGGGIVGITDPLLSRLISAASHLMQSYMSREIPLASYTEVRNGKGSQRMVTKNGPINSIGNLTIDGIAIPPRPSLGPGASTPPPWGWVADDFEVMLTGYTFTRGFQNVYLAYTAGYAQTPPDLEQACVELVGDWFKYKDRIGKASESIEGQSISFNISGIPDRVLSVLNTYKRVWPVY